MQTSLSTSLVAGQVTLSRFRLRVARSVPRGRISRLYRSRLRYRQGGASDHAGDPVKGLAAKPSLPVAGAAASTKTEGGNPPIVAASPAFKAQGTLSSTTASINPPGQDS